MPMTSQIQDGHADLHIDGELTIYTAAELAAQLLPLLAAPYDLAIDLSQVTEIDTAGLQLLMLAKRETERTGQRLQLNGHSSAMLETFELCNLAGFFGDPLLLAPAASG